MFENLSQQPPDGLLALIKLFRDDPRETKLDLGVGVYKDEHGNTPILRAIKAAEEILLREQKTKSYLGPEGDLRFVELVREIVFGETDVTGRVCGIQTPGGTGALRAAADLARRANPAARFWVSAPTWPNHRPIFVAAGAEVMEYPYFDIASQTLLFDRMLAALAGAARGDVIVLHGSCHNPTGANLSRTEWDAVISLCAERGLLPLFDLAYQGLGDGLDEDAYAVRKAAGVLGEMMVAQSCDKNFALYRERTGSLFVLGEKPDVIASNLALCARTTWSMPPDHGAVAVRLILESAELRKLWTDELNEMRERINAVRRRIAETEPALAFIGQQRGLFSNLALSPEMVLRLRTDHGVYMAKSGRINLAGLRVGSVGQFVDALRTAGCLKELA
ncbi:MAG TPA: aromatic amino acid transaminase [Acidiphilium sp.]